MMNHIKHLLKAITFIQLAIGTMTSHGMEIEKSCVTMENSDHSIDWRRMIPNKQDIERYWLITNGYDSKQNSESLPEDVIKTIESTIPKILLGSVCEITAHNVRDINDILNKYEKIMIRPLKSSEYDEYSRLKNYNTKVLREGRVELKEFEEELDSDTTAGRSKIECEFLEYSYETYNYKICDSEDENIKLKLNKNIEIYFENTQYHNDVSFIQDILEMFSVTDVTIKISKGTLINLMEAFDPPYDGAACFYVPMKLINRNENNSSYADDTKENKVDCSSLINSLLLVPRVNIEIYDLQYPNDEIIELGKSIFIAQYINDRRVKNDSFYFDKLNYEKEDVKFLYVGFSVQDKESNSDSIRRLIEENKTSSKKRKGMPEEKSEGKTDDCASDVL